MFMLEKCWLVIKTMSTVSALWQLPSAQQQSDRQNSIGLMTTARCGLRSTLISDCGQPNKSLMIGKARGHAVFENNSKMLWGCADRAMSSNSLGVVYFACLGGWNYLSPGKRPTIQVFSPCCSGTGVTCLES